MLTGILVDVSGSMHEALQLDVKLNDQSVTRAQSIFNIIMNIVQGNHSSENAEEVFVLVFGLQITGIKICDLLALLDDVRVLNRRYRDTGHESLNAILAHNGAPFAKEFIKKYLSQAAAGTLFETFSQYPDFLKDTVTNLPFICKNAAAYEDYTSAVKPTLSAYESTRTFIRGITSFFAGNDSQNTTTQRVTISYEEERAKTHIALVMESAAGIRLKDMVKPQKQPLNNVVDLLREVADSSDLSTSAQQPLTSAQLSNLVNAIKPFIYGDTPMREALEYTFEAFQSSHHTIKVLFILSDGEAKDGDPVQLAKQLHKDEVIIFACLLTFEQIFEPKRLYDAPKSNWSEAQRDMFKMSSEVSNESPAMQILWDNQWKRPESGKSRLFLHANDPKVIEEFSSLVRQMIERKDSLPDMLGYVSLDLYINCKNSMFEPKDQQQSETCYAFATATVFHLAMCRIRGCDDGVPEFQNIYDQIVEKFENKPTKTEDVLKEYASKYRLRYKKIEEAEARQAIGVGHTLVTTFRLTDEQWKAFSDFYEKTPKGTLESKHLPAVGSSTTTSGHAVVLMRCDAISLTFMNSWGTTFAKGGFFKVRDKSRLNLTFYDVYWELEDLTNNEKEAYESKCKEVAEELAGMLPSSLHTALYHCPQCSQSSPANQFTGHLLEAQCPICKEKFKPTVLGLKRSLYNR